MQGAGGRENDPADQPRPSVDDSDADGALSRDFLVRRGHCCQEGCRNCPYSFRPENVSAEARS
jgi:hypothetical protein